MINQTAIDRHKGDQTMQLDNTIRTGPDHRTDFERQYPNIAGYLSDDEDQGVYEGFDSLMLDQLDNALDQLEHACIALHRLTANQPSGVGQRLFMMVGSIFENAEDLAFDPLFTDQDEED